MDSHGKVTFSWVNDVLYTEAFGPFNEEGVRDAKELYFNTVVNRKCHSFSIIEIWDDQSLVSPQGLNNVYKFWSTLKENGCISFALVISNRLQGFIAESLLPESGKIFDNKEDAELWIKGNR